MKSHFKTLCLISTFTFLLFSCSVFKKPKEGCPSNGKNVGAEKILSGEKLPKVKKFRS